MKRLRRTDITGQKFGMLTVIERDGYGVDKDGKHYSLWKCQCECGNITTISQHLIVTGEKRSCGCLRKQFKSTKGERHGMSGTRLYTTYRMMLARCENPTDHHFKDYGGRGIKVCDEWKNSFNSFYEWAIANGYTDNLTIDRIDVNGNYEPNNCRWATNTQQQRNKRNNKRHLVNGEYLLIKEISEKYNIPEETLRGRMRYGNMTMQEAVNHKKYSNFKKEV